MTILTKLKQKLRSIYNSISDSEGDYVDPAHKGMWEYIKKDIDLTLKEAEKTICDLESLIEGLKSGVLQEKVRGVWEVVDKEDISLGYLVRAEGFRIVKKSDVAKFEPTSRWHMGLQEWVLTMEPQVGKITMVRRYNGIEHAAATHMLYAEKPSNIE